MKKIIRYLLIILLLLAALFAWLFFGPATAFSEKSKFLYIRDNEDVKTQVQNQFESEDFINSKWLFYLAAERLNVWKRLKPGRFEIKKSESIYNIIRMLRNNRQSPVRLVINKLRIREDLARMIGKNFSTDSATAMQYLNSNDSLQVAGVDTNTVMTLVIPDTYIFNWNTPVKKVLLRLQTEKDNFWNKKDRLQKAASLGYSPEQVYTLASIVEEETNKNDEKGNIASVYMNRVSRGMLLGADPTVKFALKNFALKRLYYGHLEVESPYNTYRYKGLPPGPICTPSATTIDAVLNAPKTDYIFFVAKPDFNGYHNFSTTYAEHEKYAKQYQQALNEWQAKQAQKQAAP
ncbi:endolytic transglycosylase MltG [Foetidibacter luteolus]|uniref:endolytic transglycosylase MltG n=1 Tax=Foetidibacter luteolus TaxID=2608880 RepID=UPI00129A5392|nr:endolytic transglycosylase MltG [Foetidibacter luteolus]